MAKKPSLCFWGIAVGVFASLSWTSAARQGSPWTAQLRRPVAAALLGDKGILCVANRGGSVSLVNLPQAQLAGEVPVGERLADLARLPDHKHVLVVDEKRNELVALCFDGSGLSVQSRLAVGPYPASVAVQADGTRATVASSWSRRVEVIDLSLLSSATGPVKLRILHTIRLPFAAHRQCVLPSGSEVVVADAFGGHLAVVDLASGRLVAVHELLGHNIRGLAVSADRKQLILSHQLLDQKAPTTRERIERGELMANVVRVLPLDQVLTPGADLTKAGQLLRLDRSGVGAGDPAGLALTESGHIAVALAGVNEVALVGADGKTDRRFAVGRRPTALMAGAKGQLVVLNTFDDSLSLLDTRQGAVTGTVSLGPQPPLEARDRGELLFHDARLSAGGFLSCQSCHTDGHTNGLLADTLGDNTFGTPKRTLTLMNTALTDPWGWNGGVQYLHDQVKKSLVETLHAPSVNVDQIYDLVSFLHTLPAPPPLEPPTADPADREQIARGQKLFQDHGCARCHVPPLTFSSPGTHDVGFADEKGLRNFNPPSLRGVGQGYGFLHDNRAATLEQVFTKFRHKVGPDMPEDELADLLRYLRSL